MNTILIINATTLTLAALAAAALLGAAFRWRNNTTGAQMALLTIWGLAGLLVSAFFSNLIFETSRLVAFLPLFFVPFVLVGLVLIPMTVPNMPFRLAHWMVLGSVVPLLCAYLIPGVAYEDVLPTPDGYADLVPAPTLYTCKSYPQGQVLWLRVPMSIVYTVNARARYAHCCEPFFRDISRR